MSGPLSPNVLAFTELRAPMTASHCAAVKKKPCRLTASRRSNRTAKTRHVTYRSSGLCVFQRCARGKPPAGQPCCGASLLHPRVDALPSFAHLLARRAHALRAPATVTGHALLVSPVEMAQVLLLDDRPAHAKHTHEGNRQRHASVYSFLFDIICRQVNTKQRRPRPQHAINRTPLIKADPR